jgi:uncharacterized protein YjbJ (UPF0337 family)
MSTTSSPTKGNTLNWSVKGDWKQFKGHVKEEWGKLTDNNLDVIAGKRDQLAGRLQKTYRITKDQAELQVKAFEEIRDPAGAGSTFILSMKRNSKRNRSKLLVASIGSAAILSFAQFVAVTSLTRIEARGAQWRRA